VNQGDEVRMLAIAMDRRHSMFPDVPTFRELGFDLISGAFRGTAVPKGTPEPLREEISAVLEEINRNPDHIRQMEEAGMAVLNIPYAELGDWMAEKERSYSEIARQLGATN
jgi:tripartite-type tricarboxylate transporter receptor subunit TctC